MIVDVGDPNWSLTIDIASLSLKSLNILKRAKYCQRLYNKGYSVKDIAEKYNLSESRIRQYLKN